MRKVTKIKIYFAAAAELDSDRMEIVNFFRRLNDCYLDKGLYFTLIMSGDKNDALNRDSERGGRSRELSGSSLAFFLFFAGAERDELEEFNAALDCFKKNNAPKIVIYFKNTDPLPQTEEIVRFKERLGRETDCYCNTYGHIDTLKLGILMQIKQLDLDGVDVTLENGRAWQGSEALLSLEHVEMISGYEDLQRLKTERAELESRFYTAKTKYAENPNDGAYEEFYEAARQRNEAIQEIRDIEARLYNMIEGMYERTSSGRLSKRQAEGYRLIERGLFKEAQAVLDFDGIVSESRHDEAMADKADKRAQVHVNEQLQLIAVNATLGDWDGADACYREAVRLEERYNLPKKATLAYVEFLYLQGRHAESVKAAEALRYHHNAPYDNTPDEEKGFLCNLLGIIYRDAFRMEDAEEAHKAGLEIRKKLAGRGNDEHDKDLSNSFNNLGVVYKDTWRMAEAEEMMNAALEIRIGLAGRNPDAYEPYVAYSYNNLGELYTLSQRMAEAEEMHKSAVETLKKLAERNPGSFERLELFLSNSYSNLGFLYEHTRRMAEAEEAQKAALEIRKKLAERNPDAFETYVADSYNSLGDLYMDAGRMAEAEEMLNNALEMEKRLAVHSPDAFEQDLARGYNSLGLLYYETRRTAESESMLRAALNLRIKYVSSAPEIEPALARTYKNLGNLYRVVRRTDESEEMLSKALEIQIKLAERSPEATEPDFADTNYGFGELCRDAGRIAEAKDFFSSALRLYGKYAGASPRCAKQAAETREQLELLYEAADGKELLFTPEEREIALLLTEGETQRDISRRLKLTAAEVSRQVNAIRDKVVGIGDPDPTMAAIINEFRLSRREAHILRCLRQDMTNADIASELFIAEETVRVHIHKLLKKLPVENRQDVAAWAKAFGEKKE